ncbi:MAG TPA: Hsp33 family molecular chaperone HslO, partial [Firmicutes bacterium]|nr:Hsp33 family molecular chaperone HslO [Bacillota bacterium]
MHDRDYIARAIAEGGQIRAFALTSRLLVEQAKKIHDYSPVSIAALGRTLSAALMMGDMLKGDRDLVTLIIKGDGPLKQIVATADSKGDVKGYAAVPDLELPLKPNGHLDVGRAVGKGTLTVIRDLGMREPYVGTVDLVSGEIAEDVTYYFAESEQIPTACGLGVLVDTDYTIRAAGGFLIQLMPGAQEKTVARLEQNLAHVKSVTDLLKSGETPEGLI